ncbi:MAG: MATE family efflux transporter [Methanosarcinales archaeon]|nr:MATE family efflux transporter [Methanosarcinales archaeon]
MTNEITEGNILRGLLAVSLPIVVGNLLQSVLELVDLYFVGRLGADAIAGVAMSGTIIMVLMTVVIGIVTATTAFISRSYGAREYDRVGLFLVSAMYIGLFFSVLLSLAGLFFAGDILALMGAPEAVKALGSQYLSTLLLGVFTMVELWIVSSSFQSVGDARTPMYLMVLANLINIALDPLFIFGLWIFPEMGVSGAALATVLSRGVGLALALHILCNGTSRFSFPSPPLPDLSIAWRIVRVAIPNSVQSAVRSLSFLAMMAIVAFYGASAISAYGIAGRMELVALMPGFGIATGTAVVVGQNLGARAPERAEKGVKLSLLLYGGLMAALSILYFAFAEQIMEVFDPSGSSTSIGVDYFQTVSPAYVLLAVAIVLSFAMNGAGETKLPMYATVVSMVLVQIPLALILPRWLGLGIQGVWYASVLGITCQFVIFYLLYRRGTWKHTRI